MPSLGLGLLGPLLAHSARTVQVLSSGTVNGGIGIYWMFYSGGDYEPMPIPASLPGREGDSLTLEGLRLRPGLAMSQVGGGEGGRGAWGGENGGG